MHHEFSLNESPTTLPTIETRVLQDPLKQLSFGHDVDLNLVKPLVLTKDITQSKQQIRLIRNLSQDVLKNQAHQAFWVHGKASDRERLQLDNAD
jgi:hypothetical protein